VYTKLSRCAFRIGQSKISFVNMKLVMSEEDDKDDKVRSRGTLLCEERGKKFRIFNIFLFRNKMR